MTRREAIDQIEETVQHEKPGKEEMPAPAFGEILGARQRDPPRKRPARQEPIRVGENAEHARGGEFVFSELKPANGRSFELFLREDRKDRRIALIAGVAPVEARMGI